MSWGGKREGAGRKSKAHEEQLIEKLSPLDDEAFSALAEGVSNKDFQYIKLFFEYRFGKPKQSIDATVDGEMSVVWNEAKTYLQK